jgi:outer membrane protein assembly factor BamA
MIMFKLKVAASVLALTGLGTTALAVRAGSQPGEQTPSILRPMSGKPFMMAVRDADKKRMLLKYAAIGFIGAQIACEPRFINQLGIVDLIYKIEEREPFMMEELRIQGISEPTTPGRQR